MTNSCVTVGDDSHTRVMGGTVASIRLPELRRTRTDERCIQFTSLNQQPEHNTHQTPEHTEPTPQATAHSAPTDRKQEN